MKPACGDCYYWERGKSGEGRCHRHSPLVYQSTYLHMGELFGRILWAIEEVAKIEHESFDYLYENESPFSCWPMTTEHEWCGDFRERSN